MFRTTLPLLLLLVSGTVAWPAQRIVTNVNDSGPGSLRQAILELNSSGGGEVSFLNTTGTIVLASPLPSLAANMEIVGPGTNLLGISGANQVRVFSMESGTTNLLSGMTIADGAASGNYSEFDYTYASGISNAGSLTVVECLIRNCTNNITFGAGVYNAGVLEMDSCIITECGSGEGFNGQFGVLGGALYNTGDLELRGCLISYCHAGRGGGVYNRATFRASDSVFTACAGGAEQDGAGLYNVADAALTSCAISNCLAYFGGGLMSSGTLAMTNSSVMNNVSIQTGGGLALLGSGILSGCTIANNDGGVAGGIANGADLRLFNCTVSGNLTRLAGAGGLDNHSYPFPSATSYLNHCTIVSNIGSGEIHSGAGFFSQNSILADCSGTLTSSGYNLLLSTVGCTLDGTGHDLFGLDPLLGPLQDNGGPTWTHALLSGSPAIDRASAAGLNTDQRGLLRPFDLPGYTNADDGSDIGAFELISAAPWISPVLAGRINNGETITSVAVSGNKLYVAGGSIGISSFDISDPAHPRQVSHVCDGGAAAQLELKGRELLVANSRDGLRIYDVGRSGLAPIGHVRTGGSVNAVAAQKNLAIVADNTEGLLVYRLAPKHSSPKLLSRIANLRSVSSIAFQGSRAFAAAGAQGVYIFDLHQPNRAGTTSTSPPSSGKGFWDDVEVVPTRLTGVGTASAVAIQRNHLFIASLTDGLFVYDLRNASSPQPVAHINTGGAAADVVISENLAYLANGNDGLRIYDVSVPEQPVLVARAPECSAAKALAVAGRFVCVASRQAGTFIYYTGGPRPQLQPAKARDGMHLVVHGLPGDQYTILATSDLVQWEPFATVTNLTGRIEIHDPAAQKAACRFYRVAMP